MFPDDTTAERWFETQRWPEGPRCIRCDSDNVQTEAKHKTMPFRCRACNKKFSVKMGTAMESSNLGYQKWAIALYLVNTNLKGVSSMKLHRDLKIAQRSAWHLAVCRREGKNALRGQTQHAAHDTAPFLSGSWLPLCACNTVPSPAIR